MRHSSTLLISALVAASAACVDPPKTDAAITGDASDSAARCDLSEVHVSLARGTDTPSDVCAADVSVRQEFNVSWTPGGCTLVPNYAEAAASLVGGDRLTIDGDGRFFGQTGSFTGRVGIESPCALGTGICRFLGDCDVAVVRSGMVGDAVQVEIQRSCTLTEPDHLNEPVFTVEFASIVGVMTQHAAQPALADDAGVVDASNCSAAP